MKEIIQYLSQFVTEERFELFKNIVEKRTNWCTVALEDIYQSQNASAVLRTCDCFGVQNVHIIENQYKFNVNPDVALGASQWLSLNYYNKEGENNTLNAINSLKNKGYRIVATIPRKNAVSLHNFDVEKGKFALFFGSEMPGLSKIVIDNADEFLHIPMVGFTESFNISVSAAICTHHLRWKLEQSNIKWKINDKEKEEILFNWLKTSIKSSDLIIEKYLTK